MENRSQQPADAHSEPPAAEPVPVQSTAEPSSVKATSASSEQSFVQSISIPTYKVVNETVFYLLHVKGMDDAWCVCKRFSQFEELQRSIQTAKLFYPSSAILPDKHLKILVSHTAPEFIEKRRAMLENFSRRLLSAPEVLNSSIFSNFLTTDKHDDTAVKELEGKRVQENLPEDMEITSLSIPTTRVMTDHVLYQIDCVNCRKRRSFSKWTVLKRYGQFYNLDCELREAFKFRPEFVAQFPLLPPKRPKLLNDHMDPTFIEGRRVLLENYLSRMLQLLEVARNRDFLKFLLVD